MAGGIAIMSAVSAYESELHDLSPAYSCESLTE